MPRVLTAPSPPQPVAIGAGRLAAVLTAVVVVGLLATVVVLQVLARDDDPVWSEGPALLGARNLVHDAGAVVGAVSTPRARQCYLLVMPSQVCPLPAKWGVSFAGADGTWFDALTFTAHERQHQVRAFDVAAPMWRVVAISSLILDQPIHYRCTD